jgi:hypothetical protein
MTRDTVWCDTPASFATSAITAVRRRPWPLSEEESIVVGGVRRCAV